MAVPDKKSEIEILENCEFLKQTNTLDAGLPILNESLPEDGRLIKEHSDVDALLLALRKRREIGMETNYSRGLSDDFELYIKKELKNVIQRRNLFRNGMKGLNGKMNRSMKIPDSSNHPYLNIARKELKEQKFMPLKLKSLNELNFSPRKNNKSALSPGGFVTAQS